MFPNVINPANDKLVSRTSKVGKNLLQMYKNKMKVIKKGGVNSLVPGNYFVQGNFSVRDNSLEPDNSFVPGNSFVRDNSLEPGNYSFPAIETDKIINHGKPFTLDDGAPIIFIFDSEPIIFLDNKTSELKIVKPAMIAVKWLTNIM
jgi:hypothetical protein